MAQQQEPTTDPRGVTSSRPAFSQTMQIGIVVRDLDATVRKYVEDYGIGLWQFHERKPRDFICYHSHGPQLR